MNYDNSFSELPVLNKLRRHVLIKYPYNVSKNNPHHFTKDSPSGNNVSDCEDLLNKLCT